MQAGYLNVEYHHMTMIDNERGFMPIGGRPGSGTATMKIYDNKVYGEYAPMLDCPSDGSFCFSSDKYGMGIAGFVADSRSGIPTMNVLYPYDFIMGEASTN